MEAGRFAGRMHQGPLTVLKPGRSLERVLTEYQESYSTVTDFARFLGLSTSSPLPRDT